MIVDALLDMFRGKAITMPPMDGAFRPNTALDDADVKVSCPAPDNLLALGDRILFSSGNRLLDLDTAREVMSFQGDITATAGAGDGRIAVGLDTGRVVFLDAASQRTEFDKFNCPVAMTFDDAGNLYVCNGSDKAGPADWISDLMNRRAFGSVWRLERSTGQRLCLARHVAFPYGIAVDAARDRLIVSESWRHRLFGIPLTGGAPVTVLAKLPGYPARLSPSEDGYILSLFAPRNRLIEFVLQEDAYRTDMMRDIDSRFWIAPSLSASRSFLEPLQSGGVKTMGIHKPWSPSRSYGLVVELNKQFEPVASYHSRANGARHGVTSAIAVSGRIVVASKGGDAVLSLTPERG